MGKKKKTEPKYWVVASQLIKNDEDELFEHIINILCLDAQHFSEKMLEAHPDIDKEVLDTIISCYLAKSCCAFLKQVSETTPEQIMDFLHHALAFTLENFRPLIKKNAIENNCEESDQYVN